MQADPGDPDSIREPLLYVAKTDSSLPTVTSTTPANGVTNIPATSIIKATFSEVIQASTVNPSTFVLKNSGGISIAGAVTLSGDGRTGIFTPSSPLAPFTSFTATVSPNSANSVKDLAGNAMTTPYVWSFTTATPDITQPTVVSISPVSGGTNIPVTSKVTAKFSEPMLGSSITQSTFTVKVSGSSTNLAGARWLSASDGGTTAVFAPSSNLSPSTVYVATVTTGATDLVGNPLATTKTWSFTTTSDITQPTVVSISPVSGGTNIPVTSKVTAKFSEPMLGSSITPSTFTVKVSGSSTNLAGAGSLSGTTAIFAPSSNLSPSTVYVATVTTGATDLVGNPLATTKTWSFTTTSDITQPTVVSISPVSGGTNIPVTSKVTAKFSEPMLGSSITQSTFTVKVSGSSTNLAGARWLSASDGGTTAVFAPSSNLSPSTVYVTTVTTGVTDLVGNPLATTKTWSFTTSASGAITTSSIPSSYEKDNGTEVTNTAVAANSTTGKAANGNTMDITHNTNTGNNVRDTMTLPTIQKPNSGNNEIDNTTADNTSDRHNHNEEKSHSKKYVRNSEAIDSATKQNAINDKSLRQMKVKEQAKIAERYTDDKVKSGTELDLISKSNSRDIEKRTHENSFVKRKSIEASERSEDNSRNRKTNIVGNNDVKNSANEAIEKDKVNHIPIAKVWLRLGSQRRCICYSKRNEKLGPRW